jgi:response regulator RpfG family c-di-GMP phosphodiesterase
MRHNDDLIFSPEDQPGADVTAQGGWKLLIVDDEPEVHEVTRLALTGFAFDGRPLSFLNAHSGEEAKRLLAQHSDIAMAMVDVVMEHEHAGLDLVRYIRNELKNRLIRLILRTGQPGQAPERTVIRDYDINDYKEKTELSAQKLYTCVYTGLRSYRDLVALDANRRGLETVIQASGAVFQMAGLNGFVQGVLEQMIALLYLDTDSVYINCDSLALEHREENVSIVAATGRFAGLVGADARSYLTPDVWDMISEVLDKKESINREGAYVGYFQPHSGRDDVIYISSHRPLSEDDASMIRLFLRNVAIAYENAILREEIEGTQRDIVYMLGEAIETRSKETGQHVRRVAEYCRLIALGMGLSDIEAEVLRVAAPLHDFGKIGIPDSILHKPGKLDVAEWDVMRRHSEIGEEMLSRSKREILKAAAMLAGQHHEKWDGSGYPRGLREEAIHIYGRIGAIADVFDALGSRRCYKEPWPIARIIEFLTEQRGNHFDPAIVDWVLANMDKMQEVRRQFPDDDDWEH